MQGVGDLGLKVLTEGNPSELLFADGSSVWTKSLVCYECHSDSFSCSIWVCMFLNMHRQALLVMPWPVKWNLQIDWVVRHIQVHKKGQTLSPRVACILTMDAHVEHVEMCTVKKITR